MTDKYDKCTQGHSMQNTDSALFIESIKPLSEEEMFNPVKVAEWNRLWQKNMFEDMDEAEFDRFAKKIDDQWKKENPDYLAEGMYQEGGWWGVSPYEWLKGVRLGGHGGILGKIFKPLKWIALLAAGGLGLLLAGVIKLLKEGKKQLAIARVRAWIKKLVVLADSGYKKQRKNKTSLFLLRQQARRDILEASQRLLVMAGLQVNPKTNEPHEQEVESAKNESFDMSIVPGLHEYNDLTIDVKDELNESEELLEFGIPFFGKKRPDREPSDDEGMDIDMSYVPGLDGDDASTANTGNTSGSDLLQPAQEALNAIDASRIDWSLLSSYPVSSWFGLKHKTVNIWQEIKSSANYAKQFKGLQTPQDRQSYASSLTTAAANALSYIVNGNAAGTFRNGVSSFQQKVSKVSAYAAANTPNQSGAMPNAYTHFASNVKQESIEMPSWYEDNLMRIFEDSAQVSPNAQSSRVMLTLSHWCITNIGTIIDSNGPSFACYQRAEKSMTQFLQGLSEQVHSIIDQVAKKSQDRTSNAPDAMGKIVGNMLSSKGDPNQNRSLSSLWDNVAKPKLDSRVPVHCQDIVSSPEMAYFKAVVCTVIPIAIECALLGRPGGVPQTDLEAVNAMLGRLKPISNREIDTSDIDRQVPDDFIDDEEIKNDNPFKFESQFATVSSDGNMTFVSREMPARRNIADETLPLFEVTEISSDHKTCKVALAPSTDINFSRDAFEAISTVYDIKGKMDIPRGRYTVDNGATEFKIDEVDVAGQNGKTFKIIEPIGKKLMFIPNNQDMSDAMNGKTFIIKAYAES